MSSAKVSKKKAKLKAKIVLEIINDIVIKYQDTTDFIEQKLIEKCNRDEIYQ